MDEALTAAQTVEQLGIVGLLFLILVGSIWLLFKSERRSKECEAARLNDSEERGQLKERVARVETLAPFIDVQEKRLEELHKEALDALKEINKNESK